MQTSSKELLVRAETPSKSFIVLIGIRSLHRSETSISATVVLKSPTDDLKNLPLTLEKPESHHSPI